MQTKKKFWLCHGSERNLKPVICGKDTGTPLGCTGIYVKKLNPLSRFVDGKRGDYKQSDN